MDIMEFIEYLDYGYCRVSTPKQSIDRQERNILKIFPKAHIIKETYTGTVIDGRKDWNRLYKIVTKKAEEIKSTSNRVRISFDSVSRFSRNADEGCELYEDLFNRGIELVFLNEPHINTQVYRDALKKQIDIYVNTGHAATDKFLNSVIEALNQFVIDLAKDQIRIAFEQAEKEVTDLQQKTKEGIETARLKGKQIGQKPGSKWKTKKSIEAKKLIKKYSKDFDGSNTDKEAMKIIGIARNTYYKYKKELFEENLT